MMFKTLLFSNFRYVSIQIFVTFSAIFVKNGMQNLNLLCQNYSFYQYKLDFSGYFHDFEKKSMYHLSLTVLYFKIDIRCTNACQEMGAPF
jgi:hypothetical protein